eukprot:TRINITY_DN20655_c0_g1_i1.p1 TRINITY_DN20655_c0_g1~~TRINITY_DN20655_c0_g1_i1.p1  ORF type:complete len:234 (+),score=29.47 TRINITY_DN20655_c0_g1_i1:107-703(+)
MCIRDSTKYFNYINQKKNQIDSILESAQIYAQKADQVAKDRINEIIDTYLEITQVPSFQFFLNIMQVNQDLLSIIITLCSEIEVFEQKLQQYIRKYSQTSTGVSKTLSNDPQVNSQQEQKNKSQSQDQQQQFIVTLNKEQIQINRSASIFMEEVLNSKLDLQAINQNQFQVENEENLVRNHNNFENIDKSCISRCSIY